jgi:fatty acid desaturase
MSNEERYPKTKVEWPTLLLAIACYAHWILATAILPQTLGFLPATVVLALTLTLHSSLQHEVIHGHPFGNRQLSEALVFPALGLVIPYQRFRDLHLKHHNNTCLTDPYDDPESEYMDPAIWSRLSGPVKKILLWNNTLLGRVVLGPLISLYAFYRSDLRLALEGNKDVRFAWGMHFLGALPVMLWLVLVSTLPLWYYVLAVMAALSILKIRTFLEHQAHAQSSARSVIVEDRGLLALLFLNNNFHAVHHAHPSVPWHELPGLYQSQRERFLAMNQNYRFRSYAQIFRRYLLCRKEPVAHPLMEQE